MALELRVRSISMPTSRVRAIELVAANGGPLPPFTPGAHLDLELGNGEGRSYSLCNDPAEHDRYVVAVLREAESRGGSAWMHEALAVGDVLHSSEPLNHFPLNENGEYHLLIAGGIGITPILAMARRLAAIGQPFHLHYCARHRDDAAFVDEIESAYGDSATVHFDGGDPSRGLNLHALLAKRPPGGHVYVCGPAGMIRAVREAAVDWPKGTVHFELFKGNADDTAPRSTDTGFDIVTAKTGKILHVGADQTILDVLKAEGIRVKTMCKDGVCGTCRVGLISGAPDHRDEVLTDEEQKRFIQVCVSRAQPGETLVLDL